MAGHSYGDMWINGGEVHNGDRISIVKNDIKTAFLLTEPGNINLSEFVGKLSSTAQQYGDLQELLTSLQPSDSDFVALAEDIKDLQNVLLSLQRVIEDSESGELVSSYDCARSLVDASRSLAKYQSSIDNFRASLSLLPLDGLDGSTESCRSSHTHKAMREEVRGLRDRLSTTIIVVNLHIQQRCQVESAQQIRELKEQLAAMQANSEYQRLSSLPPGLSLACRTLERAKLKYEPRFLFHKYLDSLASQQENMSTPPTPSMQISSIVPTPPEQRDRHFCASASRIPPHAEDYASTSTFQSFIYLFPEFEPFVL